MSAAKMLSKLFTGTCCVLAVGFCIAQIQRGTATSEPIHVDAVVPHHDGSDSARIDAQIAEAHQRALAIAEEVRREKQGIAVTYFNAYGRAIARHAVLDPHSVIRNTVNGYVEITAHPEGEGPMTMILDCAGGVKLRTMAEMMPYAANSLADAAAAYVCR